MEAMYSEPSSLTTVPCSGAEVGDGVLGEVLDGRLALLEQLERPSLGAVVDHRPSDRGEKPARFRMRHLETLNWHR